MHQVRIHGRGGQGVVTAAELIAIAAFKGGQFAQAFPSFGVERTGAPIEAFTRIDDQPIRLREQVYEPDVLIVQDASLIGVVDLERGTTDKTIVIVNSAKPAAELGLTLPVKNIHTIDATAIALQEIGKNIVNTVILGAFVHATALVTIEALKLAIQEKFHEKGPALVEKNIKAILRAYAG